MKILDRKEILSLLPKVSLVEQIEEGFVKYSQGLSNVPPVGELIFEDPPGDVHIKYGYLNGDDFYVIKIASGFYDNPRLGLSSSDGLMLLFGRRTGELQAVLLDRGLLTDIRTAVAGAIAAKHLAPKNVQKIGIVGTGIQAKLQLQYLSLVTKCRDVQVWGRNSRHVDDYVSEMARHGYAVSPAASASALLQECNLIVTTTPAKSPVLESAGTLPGGLHITAVGADAADKRELGPNLFRRADVVVADSVSQCLERGEIHHAVDEGLVDRDAVVELGSVIAGDAPGRTTDAEVSIADLTGVAVQDIQIAKAIYLASTPGA
jgi:ornithine cyclodeaminase